MSARGRSISVQVMSVWDRTLDDLYDILYANNIGPTDPEFERAVTMWFGADAYDAFIESYVED